MSRLPVRTMGSGLLLAIAAVGSATADEPPSPLTILDRQVRLERDQWLRWQVDYRLRYDGPSPLAVPPAELSAHVEAAVSNSRVESHAAPRRSVIDASGQTGLTGETDVLPSDDEARRCRERLVVLAWNDAEGPEPPPALARAARQAVVLGDLPELRLEPGQTLRVRLTLEHRHPLYGPFEALLGTRSLDLHLGPVAFHDRLALVHPRPVPLATADWPPRPTPEFLDTEVYLSAPDSLHLEAHVPGKQSYRYPDFRGVPYGARMRLSFWYLVAPGTEGQCQVRVSQYRDLPSSWKTLHDGELVENLSATGRWVHVDRIIRVQPEATSLTFDARILGASSNVGELWIDDVHLEPADTTILAGP